MTVDLAKIRPGDEVAVRLRVAGVGAGNSLYVDCGDSNETLNHIHVSRVFDHFPKVHPLEPGAKVQLDEDSSVGTVLAVDDVECWIKWASGRRTTARVSPALKVIAPGPIRLRAGAYYRARNGRRVGPLASGMDLRCHRFHTMADGWFDPNGKYSGHSAEHPLDLVAEWTDEASQ